MLVIDVVRDIGKVVEVVICYMGDIFDKNWMKYDFVYYILMVKEFEVVGVYIFGIKDMVGLLKLQVVYEFVFVLKEMIDILVYFYMYDMSGNGIYMYVKVVEVGVDIIDVVVSLMVGLMLQFSVSGFYYVMEGNDCCLEMNV